MAERPGACPIEILAEKLKLPKCHHGCEIPGDYSCPHVSDNRIFPKQPLDTYKVETVEEEWFGVSIRPSGLSESK
jgi:hypothetical protein